MIRIIVPTGKGREEKYRRMRKSLGSHVEFLLRANGDEGFTHAVNLVAGFALNSGKPKYLFILNDDTELFPNTIKRAVEFMEKHPNCGIMGCQNLSMEDKDLIIWGGSGDPYPAGQHKVGRLSLGDLQEPTKERWVTFSSAFIRREVFETIGLLDEKMVWVYSDADFSYRARYYGWECWHNPCSKIYHEHGVSRKPGKKRMMRFRLDQMAFANKWMNGKAYFDLDSEKF